MPLTASFSLTATGTLTKDDQVSVVNDPVSTGQKSFPSLTFDLTDGTLASQANKWHRSYRTIANGANLDLDLAGSLTDPFGQTLTFTRIVAIVIAIVSPDGTKVLRVGPAGVANAWQGPFGGTGATVYLSVKYWQSFVDYSTGGWTVTAGTGDILRISNPGAASVDCCVWIIGN